MSSAHAPQPASAPGKNPLRVARLPPRSRHATAVIHELALHFRIGTPKIMIGQLERLLEPSHRPNLVIQVVRDTGYFPGLRGPYKIASVGVLVRDTTQPRGGGAHHPRHRLANPPRRDPPLTKLGGYLAGDG